MLDFAKHVTSRLHSTLGKLFFFVIIFGLVIADAVREWKEAEPVKEDEDADIYSAVKSEAMEEGDESFQVLQHCVCCNDFKYHRRQISNWIVVGFISYCF